LRRRRPDRIDGALGSRSNVDFVVIAKDCKGKIDICKPGQASSYIADEAVRRG
jgi:hypothetical protein